MKVVMVIILCLWVATFAWMNDLEKRQRFNERMDGLRWQAQIEAFSVYSKVTNEQRDLLIKFAEAK